MFVGRRSILFLLCLPLFIVVSSSGCWFSLSSVGRVWFPFFCSSQCYIIHLEANVLVSSLCVPPASLSAFIHKRPPPRFPLAAYTNKHTPVCRWKQILMKSNWEENIWYLSFMFGLSWAFYWKRPVEIESLSLIWEVDERKKEGSRRFPLFLASLCHRVSAILLFVLLSGLELTPVCSLSKPENGCTVHIGRWCHVSPQV